jgi:hypothetical protein
MRPQRGTLAGDPGATQHRAVERPDAFIAAWVESERAACLASASSQGAPASRSFRDFDEVLDDEAEKNGEVKGLTLGEIEHLESRAEAGEVLSEEEQAWYKAAKNRMRLASFSATLAASSEIGSFGSVAVLTTWLAGEDGRRAGCRATIRRCQVRPACPVARRPGPRPGRPGARARRRSRSSS